MATALGVGLSAVVFAALSPIANATTQGETPAVVGDPTALVDPFVGTGSGGNVVGPVNMFPGAAAPFGMLDWSPDTTSRPSSGGYNYADSSTIGLSVTHVAGAGCGIAGDLPILPTVVEALASLPHVTVPGDPTISGQLPKRPTRQDLLGERDPQAIVPGPELHAACMYQGPYRACIASRASSSALIVSRSPVSVASR